MRKSFKFQPKKQNDIIRTPNNIQEPKRVTATALSPIKSSNYFQDDYLNEIDNFHQVEIINDKSKSNEVFVNNQIEEKFVEQNSQPVLDYIKSYNEIEDLDFINTLIRLKSGSGSSSSGINPQKIEQFQSKNVSPPKEQSSIHVNNDDSKSYIREILDICDLRSNNIDNSSIYNINDSNAKVSKGLQRNDLIEITNRRKKMADSLTSVDPYLRRRHLEELAKVEKIRKEKERKEMGDGTFMPKINKKSKMICERMNSGKIYPPDDDNNTRFFNNQRNIQNTSGSIKETKFLEEEILRASSMDNSYQNQMRASNNNNKKTQPIISNNQPQEFRLTLIKDHNESNNYHDWINERQKQLNKGNEEKNVSKYAGNNNNIKMRDEESEWSPKYDIHNNSSHFLIENNFNIEDNLETEKDISQLLNRTSALKEDNKEVRRINLKAIKEEVRQKTMLENQIKIDDIFESHDQNDQVQPYIKISFDFAEYQLKSLMNQANQDALIDKSIVNSDIPKDATNPKRPQFQYNHNVSVNQPANISQQSQLNQYSKLANTQLDLDILAKYQNVLKRNTPATFNEEEFTPEYVINNPVPLNELVKESNMSDCEDNPQDNINELINCQNHLDEHSEYNNNIELNPQVEELFSPDRNYYSNILGLSNSQKKDQPIVSKYNNENNDEVMTEEEFLNNIELADKDKQVIKTEINLFDDDEDEDEDEKGVLKRELSNPNKNSFRINPLSLSQDHNTFKKMHTSIESIKENQIEFDIDELMNPKYLFKHANDFNSLDETSKEKKNRNSKSVSTLEHINEEKPKEKITKLTPNNSSKEASSNNKFQPRKSDSSYKPISISTFSPQVQSNLKKKKYEFKPRKKNGQRQSTEISHRNIGASQRPQTLALKSSGLKQKDKNQTTNLNPQSTFDGGYFKRIIQQDKTKIDSLLLSTENLGSNILITNGDNTTDKHLDND